MPFLKGQRPDTWREYAICENDYGVSPGMAMLANQVADPRQFMVATKRWKYIHAQGFRPMLFDLENDPDELVDLGNDPTHEDVRREMAGHLSDWARRLSQRTTMSPEQIATERARSPSHGILLGAWDENETPPDQLNFYGPRRGPEH